MMRGFVTLLITVALVAATPVERKRDGPLVVDIPADMFSENDDTAPLPSIQEKEVELIQPPTLTPIDGSVEEVDIKKPDSDPFGFRVPTIFVIRRPVISDRFPFFQPQQSPFQNFRPFSFFENRRPIVQRPVVSDNNSDESTHDMVSHMEQMMKRMQQQMSSLWGTFASPSFQRPLRPLFPAFESSELESSNETLSSLDNLPANYSNTTSETKVVDGHVVQVNKTIHKISSGNNNSGFFHFEVINVRPTEKSKTETPVPESTDVKPIVENPATTVQPEPSKAEDPTLNEVGETKSTVDGDNTFPQMVNRRSPFSPSYDDSDEPDVEWIPRREYQRPPSRTLGMRSRTRSLDDDLWVNRVVEEQRLMSPYLLLNPDVELINV